GLEDGNDRPENLLAIDPLIVPAIDKNGRLEIVPRRPARQDASAEPVTRAVAGGVLDIRCNPAEVGIADQGTDIAVGIECMAHLHPSGTLDEPLDEDVVDRCLDDDAAG